MKFPFFRKPHASNQRVPSPVLQVSRCPPALARRIGRYRPGDRLSAKTISQLQPPAEFEGWRTFCWYPPSPQVVISPSGQIAQIAYSADSGGVFGIEIGTSLEDALLRHDNAELVAERNDEANGQIMKWYLAPLADGRELTFTSLNGAIVWLAWAQAGYWRDSQERSNRETAALMARHQAAQDRYARIANGNDWQAAQDPDDMLNRWAKSGPHTRRDIAESLLRSKATDRLRIGRSINWDDGLAPCFWIIRKPDTPVEAVFDIFVMAEPEYHCHPARRESATALNEFALLQEMRRLLNSGFYKASSPFDPRAAWEDAHLGNRDADFLQPWREAFLASAK